MLAFILPGDPAQALRIRRILLASAAYLMWMVLGGFMYAMDLLRIGIHALMLYYLAIIFVNALFLGLVRSNLNLQFKDPSMTLAQIAVSIVIGMIFVAVIVPGARATALLLFISALFFGIFRLRTIQFVMLAFFAVGLYGALILWEAGTLTPPQLQVELVQLVVFGAVLLWLAFMGSYVARLRAELHRAMQRIESLANTDDLTGTENRRSITTALRAAIEIAEQGGENVSICLLDIDHFKKVNDRYGHPVGDEVLRAFVERIRGKLRDKDILGRGILPGALGRFGGEEFLLVLRGTDESSARLVAERIRGIVIYEPFDTNAGPVQVTVSAGVAAWRPHETEVELLRRTDRALYQAKDAGRDRVYIAEPENSTAAMG